MADDKIEIRNVLQPGKTYRVNGAKFHAASDALLNVLPLHEPGLTQAEMMAAAKALLADADFPGSTQGWWIKGAQLHLEATGEVIRDKGKPLRWRRVG